MGEAKRKNTRLYFEALTKIHVLKLDVRRYYPKISDNIGWILRKCGGDSDRHG